MTYGVPYMGSKSKIAREVVENLPPAEVFVDLFAGGCAITHAAMLAGGKYKRFLVNDVDWRGITLFRDAILGKYKDEKRVITREMFQSLKDTDAYVALCWSFGNNPEKGYLWGADIADFKCNSLRMLFAEDIKERYRYFRIACENIRSKTTITEKRMHDQSPLEKLGRLQGLERLQRTQGMEIAQELEMSVLPYDKVEIPKGACVYCDPPYYGTSTYSQNDFNHEDFYTWLRTREYPVYISEYSMPKDFKIVWETKKLVTLSATDNSKKVKERLFIHEKWYDKIHKNDLFGFEDI